MGEQRVSLLASKRQRQRFMKALLRDVTALEYMLDNDWFESDTIRIGAEQELCLVDSTTYKPKPIAMEVIEKLNLPWLETELARFNLETNVTPQVFSGDCFQQVEKEIRSNLKELNTGLSEMGARMVLTGILPTLRKFHLDMEYITPMTRYSALMEAINDQLQAQSYELRLTGIDELSLRHDSPMLEACNTSFQVHLQVAPSDFVKLYNISQVLVAPVMATSANSPIVFGKRLWHESRIALFQQALDTRSSHDHLRERAPRVNFGVDWLKDSILEIYKEDIARFRVLLSADIKEDSQALIKNNKVPKLRALQVHNSTVYRWNRPCYGVSDNGKPHLRIENRVLLAGPTILDEISNAAFWLGAMTGYGNAYDDITQKMTWEDARDNFGKAARNGLDSRFIWLGEKNVSACDLVLEELLPLAREGLKSRNVETADIDKYLGVIKESTKQHTTGARWMLRSFTDLIDKVPRDEAVSILTATMVKNQEESKPVHEWDLPGPADLAQYQPSRLKVEEFMIADVFTAQADDIVQFVSEMMLWRKIRHLPIEDTQGNLVGLVSSRTLLRHMTDQKKSGSKKVVSISDIMISEPITIAPDANILDAMRLMEENKIGCLPVCNDLEQVGIITEKDSLNHEFWQGK